MRNSVMKYILLILLIFIASCTPQVHKLSSYCTTPKKELFLELVKIGKDNKMNVIKVDTYEYILKLQTEPKSLKFGIYMKINTWSFKYKSDTLTAVALESRHETNIRDKVVAIYDIYLNDEEAEQTEAMNWYWQIRNRIEQICGSKITFKSYDQPSSYRLPENKEK